jgi:hypothetical protein
MADNLTDCLEIWEPQPSGTLRTCRGIDFALLAYVSVTKYDSGSNPFNRSESDDIIISLKGQVTRGLNNYHVHVHTLVDCAVMVHL